MSPILWWIRRDLRIEQNATLKAAFERGTLVIPVFILDDRLLSLDAEKRQLFLFSGLHELNQRLKARGSGLIVRHEEPVTALAELVRETGAEMIFAEEDFSQFARQRDEKVARELPLQLVSGLTVLHPSVVKKPDGTPYTVFTPFRRAWKAMYYGKEGGFTVPEKFPLAVLPPSLPLPDFEPLPGFPPGELEARRRLEDFLSNSVQTYQDDRDYMGQDGTSNLSPYFRFGMLSAAEAARRVSQIIEQSDPFLGNQGEMTWLTELIWREFYQSILYNFPDVQKQAFNPKLRNIPWQDAPGDLQDWKDGQTGYPIVDAAMRQLKATGWMHNRARMITASFLTKDLLINWQEGERWFNQQLVDGDPAANNGGWQWSAGTGTDAAPYFRIFNPVLQSKKFDPLGVFIRHWVPELQAVPDEWLHEPWKMDEQIQISTGVKIGKSYPSPIVDHAIVKERTMAAYKTSQQHYLSDTDA